MIIYNLKSKKNIKTNNMSFNELLKSVNNFNKRLTWEQYFSLIVNVTKLRSSCDRLKVGCIIIRDNRILTTGYNGHIPGSPHNSYIENNHEQLTIHAEVNAVSYASKNGININNSVAYITHYPCPNCTKALISSGIKEIYYLNDYNNSKISQMLLQSAGIKVNKILL